MQSYSILIAAIIGAVYSQIDKILLGQMLDIQSVGFYTATITICSIWAFFPGALLDSARPIIMELKEKSNDLYIRRIKQLSALIIWLSIVVAIFITFTAKWIVLFLYGSEYVKSVPLLQLYCWTSCFPFLASIRTIWFICERKVKFEMIFEMVAMIIFPILSYIFIHLYGMAGAVWAVLASKLITVIIVPFILKDTREIVLLFKEALFLKNIITKDEIQRIKYYFEKAKC